MLANGLTHRDLLELEALQAQALKSVENQIQQEIARRKALAGGSGSYGTPQGGSRHDDGIQQPNLSTPPGLPQTTVLGIPPTASVKNVFGFGHTPHGSQSNALGIHGDLGMQGCVGNSGSGLRVDGAQHPPGNATAQVGESLAESLRNLELPRLSENTTALSLGDWLAVVDPIMSDLSSTSCRCLVAVGRRCSSGRVSPMDLVRTFGPTEVTPTGTHRSIQVATHRTTSSHYAPCLSSRRSST